MVNRLDRLRDVLLAQCKPHEVELTLELVDRRGAGVVVTRPDRGSLHDLAATAGEQPLLVDAARYAGNRRLAAAAEFDRGWLSAQRDAELLVLTDSGYTARDDEDGLLSILHRTAEIGDAVGVLALDPWWLDLEGGLERLLDHVRRVGVPIAVVLEHAKDPLGERPTLRGLLALLDTGVPVIQLRCDTSGLGLLCHGAWATAVGTSSSQRHLYPRTKPGDYARPESVSTVVRDCLAYHEVNLIARAIRADPENSLWQGCICRVCNARPLDWIARLPTPDAQRRAAFGHALETLFDWRDYLLRTSDRAARQQSWHANCSNALARYREINAVGQRWRAPKSLRRWYEIVVPTPAATR